MESTWISPSRQGPHTFSIVVLLPGSWAAKNWSEGRIFSINRAETFCACLCLMLLSWTTGVWEKQVENNNSSFFDWKSFTKVLPPLIVRRWTDFQTGWRGLCVCGLSDTTHLQSILYTTFQVECYPVSVKSGDTRIVATMEMWRSSGAISLSYVCFGHDSTYCRCIAPDTKKWRCISRDGRTAFQLRSKPKREHYS